MDAYEKRTGGLFFVYGSEGTGKTYLWRTLIAKLRSQNKIVLSVASSGIVALLLPNGRTANSRFKIPLNLHQSSCCYITQGTDLALLIAEAELIIWDEVPMLGRYAFDAVDRTFRDIIQNTDNCSSDKVFGGKSFLLRGDLRQIPPIITKGGHEQIVGASLPRSSIWKYCKVLHLHINMRVTANNVSEALKSQLHDFAEWIKMVGEGKISGTSFGNDDDANWFKIPCEFLIGNDEVGVQRLIEPTYLEMLSRYRGFSYLNERAILAPKNIDVDKLNSVMLLMIPGEKRVFYSADNLCPTSGGSHDHVLHPPEFLNSLDFPGLPSHTLELKVGAPIMLLRSLNQCLGLCNGTRLVVDKMGDKVIQAKVITGSRLGEIVLISRAILTPMSVDSPFALRRRKFPVKLAFAMTINKSQGQTLKNVGVYLPNPVFSHGQLYVALSRATSLSGLKMLVINKEGMPNDITKNVVYREVFNDISD